MLSMAHTLQIVILAILSSSMQIKHVILQIPITSIQNTVSSQCLET
jgi:hypothetical protein